MGEILIKRVLGKYYDMVHRNCLRNLISDHTITQVYIGPINGRKYFTHWRGIGPIQHIFSVVAYRYWASKGKNVVITLLWK